MEVVIFAEFIKGAFSCQMERGETRHYKLIERHTKINSFWFKIISQKIREYESQGNKQFVACTT